MEENLQEILKKAIRSNSIEPIHTRTILMSTPDKLWGWFGGSCHLAMIKLWHNPTPCKIPTLVFPTLWSFRTLLLYSLAVTCSIAVIETRDNMHSTCMHAKMWQPCTTNLLDLAKTLNNPESYLRPYTICFP